MWTTLQFDDADPELVLEEGARGPRSDQIVFLEESRVVTRPLDQVALLVVVGDEPDGRARADRLVHG